MAAADIPLSVLDLAPITDGSTAAVSLRNSLDLAQHAERWGYARYWIAEHHNMPGIASAATAIVIGHVAAGTKTIRVGAGGIMLPNHAPLVVAEQFGTLESLFPAGVDLGLGRAWKRPGHSAALRRPAQHPRVPPTARLWRISILRTDRPSSSPEPDGPYYLDIGSSLFGAQVAAMMGLPFAFASHFAAAQMTQAIAIYRERFQSSGVLDRPYVMLGVNVVAADTDEEARLLATSGRQAFASLRRGMPTTLPPPNREFEKDVVPFRGIPLEEIQSVSIVGSPETVRDDLRDFIARTQADELIVVSHIYDHAARLRSYEIVASELIRGHPQSKEIVRSKA